MLTQCPACNTTFRVTAEQIKAKSGRVRCGECQNVFNALDTLIDALPDSTFLLPTEKNPQQSAPLNHLANATTETTHSRVADSDSTDSSGAVTIPEEILSVQTSTEEPRENFSIPSSHAKMPLERLTVEPSTHNPPEPTNILLDKPFADLARSPAIRRWPWIVGSVVLLIMLGGQVALALRAPIAKSFPAAQPVITALCRLVPCKTRLPAQADLISIESSDLHPDPTKAGRLVVSATLKNRAAFSQQFPHLELTLTDMADKAVLRKVLPPTTYLPPNTATANGMPPNADIDINLVIDIDPLTANGYRLYLFYP